MKTLFTYLKGDRTIWIISILLVLISILAVYSSISQLAFRFRGGNTFPFLFKHGLMLCIGLLFMYYIHRIRYKFLYPLSTLLLWVAGILLLVTLIFGTNINEAQRWLTIPLINQTFQTSDLAKIVLVIYLARSLSQKQDKIRSFRNGVLPVIIPVALICGLILPANFSTAALLFITCLAMMFVAKVRITHFAILFGGIVISGALMFFVTKAQPGLLPRLDTWVERVDDFKSGKTEDNYQVERAKIAIYTGGLLPNGPGKGKSRNYLPHPYSDMIYAFIIEEYGLIIGGLGVMFLYLVLFFRILKIAYKSQRKFGTYMAFGLGFMIVFQAMTNMAVSVNLIPVTGQPLPLISMGGTSIWFTCIAIGLILSVARETENELSVNTEKKTIQVA